MTALSIGLAVWLALAVAAGIPLGLFLKRVRRAHPIHRAAANDDVIRFPPPSRRRARRGR